MIRNFLVGAVVHQRRQLRMSVYTLLPSGCFVSSGSWPILDQKSPGDVGVGGDMNCFRGDAVSSEAMH